MELKKITFAPNDEGESTPETVTVKMTAQEALWIATVSGKQKGESPHNSIFSCLNGDVFNRYWDDGTDDAIKEFPIEIPPIIYPD